MGWWNNRFDPDKHKRGRNGRFVDMDIERAKRGIEPLLEDDLIDPAHPYPPFPAHHRADEPDTGEDYQNYLEATGQEPDAASAPEPTPAPAPRTPNRLRRWASKAGIFMASGGIIPTALAASAAVFPASAQTIGVNGMIWGLVSTLVYAVAINAVRPNDDNAPAWTGALAGTVGSLLASGAILAFLA